VKAGQPARPKAVTKRRRYKKKTVTENKEKSCQQYLIAVYHPDDYDPSVETEATIEEIHALNAN
jgi:hypothetical protein